MSYYIRLPLLLTGLAQIEHGSERIRHRKKTMTYFMPSSLLHVCFERVIPVSCLHRKVDDLIPVSFFTVHHLTANPHHRIDTTRCRHKHAQTWFQVQ